MPYVPVLKGPLCLLVVCGTQVILTMELTKQSGRTLASQSSGFVFQHHSKQTTRQIIVFFNRTTEDEGKTGYRKDIGDFTIKSGGFLSNC